MKTRILLSVCIALFFALPASAQLLWKISGKGLSKPSYLFGTHHLIEKDRIKNFDKMLGLVSQTDAVVGEMDMTDMPSMQAKIMQSAVMPGKNIKQMLNTDDYALVDNEFKQLMGVGLDQLGAFKPMLLQTMYASLIYFRSQNIDKQPEAVDVVFQKKAKENNKSVIGLETIELQSAIMFDSLPLNRQVEILVKSVKDKQKGIDLYKRLNEAYLAGNLKKIEDLDKEDDDLTPAERKPLYDNRNANWLKQLPALLTKQSCFVVVGCMHLVGETGLLLQLKQAGYKVEAVENL
jgi:Uncharacterized protein conserved in bacteria